MLRRDCRAKNRPGAPGVVGAGPVRLPLLRRRGCQRAGVCCRAAGRIGARGRRAGPVPVVDTAARRRCLQPVRPGPLPTAGSRHRSNGLSGRLRRWSARPATPGRRPGVRSCSGCRARRGLPGRGPARCGSSRLQPMPRLRRLPASAANGAASGGVGLRPAGPAATRKRGWQVTVGATQQIHRFCWPAGRSAGCAAKFFLASRPSVPVRCGGGDLRRLLRWGAGRGWLQSGPAAAGSRPGWQLPTWAAGVRRCPAICADRRTVW